MNDKTVQIEVNGQVLTASPEQMLIEVTDANDIYIPRFCYHKKLSVAANCRMCLIEVEKAPKPLPACATPVMDGMKVSTQSALAVEAQKSVMEFLLINHPLDCPICDQGGECELQDLAMGYGGDVSRYQEKKRVVMDKNIGALIQTDMTRCIHCTRCVRFGEEIAGLREMGATGRGEYMEIGTYIEKSLSSELSGNIIDICPVGALTSKPFRYSARSWEMVQKQGIAPHDSVGSNIELHIKEDIIKRVVPAENEAINEVWLSDRDRFSYEGLYSADRLQKPMIKNSGIWKEVDWKTAFAFIREQLQIIMSHYGGSQLGGLASATATLEELYLLQKLLRGLDCHNIDHRLRQKDFRQQEADPLFPYLGTAIADLETVDTCLLIGSNIRKEQPILNHRLRKAALKGAEIMVINSVNYDFNYDVSATIIQSPVDLPIELASIIKAVVEINSVAVDDALQALIVDVAVNDTHKLMAKKLADAEHGLVLLGNLAQAHEQFSVLKMLALTLTKLTHVQFGFLSEAANSSGACLAGMLPHRGVGGMTTGKVGLNADTMFSQTLRAYILLGIEPELDCWDGKKAMQALHSANFVLSLTAYQSEKMKEYADVLLPIASFAETSGTYINIAGQAQSFTGVVPPVGQARPTWKILRVLANQLDLSQFQYNSSEEVYNEINASIGDLTHMSVGQWTLPKSLKTEKTNLQRITEVPMYRVDPLTRRAEALQNTEDSASYLIQINAKLAQALQCINGDVVVATQKDNSFMANITINDNIADDCVLVQATHALSAYAWHGAISLRKA